ncbi:MAG: L-ribulose-5-phosphate 4-epimerase AraD [Candidatus Hydrogenedentes bacterium]|nr:L-ribulose-5-phosphate 4-epimerase AraD [Candidatus Hydrogenedentota bacterium]
MFGDLRKAVCEANLDLAFRGLVMLTWGNASAVDRESGHVVIKPSGLVYEKMKPRDMVVVNLSGEVVEGELKPSVDLPIHLALYAAFTQIGGIAHSHSHYATCWAQACNPIPCLGTTHADYFCGDIPVTNSLRDGETGASYEQAVGQSIVRCFDGRDPLTCPAVLVAKHAPFTWGASVSQAVENSIVLEEVARMAYHSYGLNPSLLPIPEHLLDKHFHRKHGDRAYYGQPGRK